MKVTLFEAAAAVLGEPAIGWKVGASVVDLDGAAGVKAALRSLGSARLVFELVTRASTKFTRSHRYESLELAPGSARIRQQDVAGVGHHAMDCDYTRGLLASVPCSSACPRRRCATRSAPCAALACVYEIEWEDGPRCGRWLAAGAASALAVGLGARRRPRRSPSASA
ncbi:MAG: hypothetical protein M3P39_03710 [Actinomycetota bacterium]|nr:hypothetical protein [Actinomycetota bacterium]